MAVKPWIGAVVEPDQHNDPNPNPPDVMYTQEYIYGYRCADSRQNLFYNPNGEAVYMTAAMGVILDKKTNTQKFFGGGAVEAKHKSQQTDANSHNNDIMCLAMSFDRTKVITGQVGKKPVAFVWDAKTGEKIARFALPSGSRGVNACAFNKDASKVACVDLHNDHNVFVYDAKNGSLLHKEKGDGNKIFDCCFSGNSDDFATAGVKHLKFWNMGKWKAGKKGIYGGKGDPTSFACVTSDTKSNFYTGGTNGKIYVWADRMCKMTFDCHTGFICTMQCLKDNTLLSGGKDGNINLTDCASGK